MKRPILLAGSILSADFGHLADDTNAALRAGMDHIHFDVMDHHYVPNLSFGALVCDSLRKANITAPIDVHLMVTDPLPYIEPFATAGANSILFHSETVRDINATIHIILQNGMDAGLVLNPGETLDISPQTLARLNRILIMSVQPGFGGQTFLPSAINALHHTRRFLDRQQLNTQLGIDGGINPDTIGAAYLAGADYFVVGSSLFKSDDYDLQVQKLYRQLDKID